MDASTLNSGEPRPGAKLTLRDVTKAIRTRQWAKNGLLFAGFLFAGRLRAPDGAAVLQAEALRVVLGFLCFCGLSATAYLINDWKDIERDRLHPVKKSRPLASGRMSKGVALVLMGVCASVAVLAAAVAVGLEPRAKWFVLAGGFYFVLTLAYSFALKHEVLVDVLCVALGFVVRVVAGCLVVPVPVSPWIIFCTFMLALLIALCKRRAELQELGAGGSTRSVLNSYTVPLLDTCIAVAAGLTITSYSLYTFSATETSTALPPSLRHEQTPLLMLTIPFVVYGVFRFLLLAHSSSVGGEPEQMLRDKRLVLNMALWAVTVALLTVIK